MNDFIKRKVIDNIMVVKNFSYLSILRFFNLLLPLITYPYLIKILGFEIYGKVIFAQVIVGYFGILIDFGFNISATKEVSIYRENFSKLSDVISSIFQIKLGLWLLSFFLLAILINTIPYFTSNKILLLVSFLICFNELLFPQWFFQGIEEMKYITFINLFSRLLFVALIFVLIKTKDDFIMVPLLNGIGVFVGGMLGVIIMYSKYKINFKLQSINACKDVLLRSVPIFYSNIIISVKDRFSTFFIGSFLGMDQVAIYDLGIKVLNIFIQPIDIANAAIYPQVAKNKNMKYVNKFIKYSFVITILIIIFAQVVMPYLLEYLIDEPDSVLLIVRYLLIVPLIMSISLPLARNCLIINGKNKKFALGMLYTTIFYLLCIGLAFALNITNYLLTYVFITILTYIFELVYRLYISKKYSLI